MTHISLANFSILFALILSIAFSSCASQNTVERLAYDDCLILIPTTMINEDNVPAARSYYLHINDGDRKFEIRNVKSGYIPVVIQGEGAIISTLSTDVKSAGGSYMVGGSHEWPLNLALPYQRGEILVYDHTFQQRLTKVMDGSYRSVCTIIETTDEDKKKHFEDFLKRPEAASWID